MARSSRACRYSRVHSLDVQGHPWQLLSHALSLSLQSGAADSPQPKATQTFPCPVLQSGSHNSPDPDTGPCKQVRSDELAESPGVVYTARGRSQAAAAHATRLLRSRSILQQLKQH
ncbi:hypothetical protein AAFF_G00413830 [Aldrovandia affinis]|uniref:Uncharacterized protein n=1 Tax=Aldrovandia affinis TaxID=143900 RepID=A0AAD7WJV4_9TELE|nr:hypothetical protein AAFF_G00413830 [Aldrovandia affinis]